MGDVLSFPSKEEDFKAISYKETDGVDLGIGTLDGKIAITRLNSTEFLVETPDGSTVHTRASLAEFLWVAVIFVDGDQS